MVWVEVASAELLDVNVERTCVTVEVVMTRIVSVVSKVAENEVEVLLEVCVEVTVVDVVVVVVAVE